MESRGEKRIGIDWDSLAVRQGDSLPHWTCERAIYHVTFRLADSVPQCKRLQWVAERRNILDGIALLGREPTEHECERLQQLYSARIETFLHVGHGKCFLACCEIGEMVAAALEFFHGKRYWLHAYCIMPNHVHAIVEPLCGSELPCMVRNWKSYTAKRANHLLGRQGVFWQHDSYDHVIRSEEELGTLLEYVWENPGAMASGFVRKRFD